MTTFNSIQNLLQDKSAYLQKVIHQKVDFENLLPLQLASILMIAFYGFVMGMGHSPLQAASTAVKLPFLLILTSLICFPTLYFFLSILNVKLRITQLVGLGIISMTLMSVCLIAFVPVTVFFLVTSNNYALFKIINVGVFAISGFIGVRIYSSYISKAISMVVDPINRSRAKIFMLLWLMLYGLVGAQLSWTLSPFMGIPGEPFIWLTPEKSNFFLDILRSVVDLMGF